MRNSRVTALFAQVVQATTELIAEFTYLETVCADQGAEIKQLKFEASGQTDLRVSSTRALINDCSDEMMNQAILGPWHWAYQEQGAYFDVGSWRWVAIIDVPVQP